MQATAAKVRDQGVNAIQPTKHNPGAQAQNPGPILINVGEGKLYALAALAGTLLGAYLFGALYPALQKPLGLPPLSEGPGEG